VRSIRVLFAGGGKRYSAAEKLIQAGNELDLDVKIYAYEMGFGLPIADIATVVQGKKFSDPEILQHLEETLRECSIDIALPYHDRAISLLAALSHRVFVPTCSSDLAQIFGSKIQSAAYFRRQAIPLPGFSGEVPAIAKPDMGSASQGMLRFSDQSKLDAFLSSPERVHYEVQDLVSGPEYSVDGYIALNSDFRHFAVRQRLETLGGESVRSQTVDIPQVEAQCHRLSGISGVRGAITMQFIFDSRNGEYGIMEVNPRFGGGMLTSWGAGVPWFHILLRDFLDLPQAPVCHKTGVLMVRSFREHFFKTS
jgi:carbamoyl-phosphate synthase large subunit